MEKPGSEALSVTLDGLERCLALARVAAEYGDVTQAAAHILGGLSDLDPELGALDALLPRAAATWRRTTAT